MAQMFYKYMTYKTAEIVLENQTLRWSTPSSLNDPYDIQFDLRADFDRQEVVCKSLEKLWKVFTGEIVGHPGSKMSIVMNLLRPHLKGMPKEYFVEKMEAGIQDALSAFDKNIHQAHKSAREHLATSKILCLTESPVNQLMWAYYADSNKGVVLRFQDEFGADSPYQTAKPISYMLEMPMIFDEDELSDFLAGLVTFETEKRINALVYTKSDAWKHEREWRIFAGDGRDKYAPYEDKAFGFRELTAVIFGCRTPLEQRTAMSLIIHRLYPHAEILQAAPLNNSFQLELYPFKVA